MYPAQTTATVNEDTVNTLQSTGLFSHNLRSNTKKIWVEMLSY